MGWDTFRRNFEDTFSDGPEPAYSSTDDFLKIDQNASPTCVILAALAATANWTGKFPGFGTINQDLTKNISYDAAKDLYGVRLFVNGGWQTVWVNSDWNEYWDPQGPLWVALYQKAYLQAMNVVYKAADGSYLPVSQWKSTTGKLWQHGAVALQAITGQTAQFTASTAAAAATMRQQLLAGKKIVGLTKASVNSELVANHAYAVLDVFWQNGTWKLKLFNPWGHDRKGTALDGVDDGVLTIAWSTFLSYFYSYAWN
ncbi:MAG: C2 family cysteine protease [Gemmataceae bacterium]|nr:C2 family cysteine protease [Gemmataceae bacterium]MCI0739947.1 C2 family cysteine protease [Gemmataceae bacterium]